MFDGKSSIQAAVLCLFICQAGSSVVWGYGQHGHTETELIQPNGDLNGFDNRGHTWSEKDGTLLNSDGSGCTIRGGVKQCWKGTK